MNQKLSGKQVEAIVFLSKGFQANQISEKLSVAPQTISKWRQNPVFEAELNAVKQSMLDGVLDRVRESASSVVDTLLELTISAENSEIRRKACMDILNILGICGLKYGAGIGPTTPKQVVIQKSMDDTDDILATSLHATPSFSGMLSSAGKHKN